VSLLFRGGAPRTESRAALPASMVRALTSTSNSVVVSSAEVAMQNSAVWGCVTKIAQDVAMMPVDVGRKTAAGWVDLEPKPQIIAAPSSLVDDLDWRYQVIVSWLTAGNAWGTVTERSRDGMYPARIELLQPRSVRVRAGETGPEYFVDNVQQFLFPVGDLWHRPAYTMAGHVLGLSPIAYHAETIGLGLTARKFGADYLGDGGHPSALIQPEGNVGTEQATALKERFMALTRGNREPIVIPSTTKYTPIQVNPEESQFLTTMQYTANEIIANVFLEDPADYGGGGAGSSLTYANRSDADLARFKRRQFWVTKLQKALTDLVTPDVMVRLNTSSALMMTATERHTLHKLRLDAKTTTVNRVLAIEDEPPFGPEFDLPGIPQLPQGGAV
jgi:HK97 family phage portal protein